MDDVRSRHPSITTTKTEGEVETDQCLHQCIEVMRHISNGKLLIADPSRVVRNDTYTKLTQLVKEPPETVDQIIEALHSQFTKDQQLRSEAQAAMELNDLLQDGSQTALNLAEAAPSNDGQTGKLISSKKLPRLPKILVCSSQPRRSLRTLPHSFRR